MMDRAIQGGDDGLPVDRPRRVATRRRYHSRCGGRCSARSFICWTSGPFPRDDPLPGAYELHLPADDVTIWYTVTEHEGQDVISVQHVSADTDFLSRSAPSRKLPVTCSD